MRLPDNSDVRDRAETTDYMISVSDLMSGLLFIFIIILAVFIMKSSEASKALSRTTSELESTRKVRKEILEAFRDSLAYRNIHIKLDLNQGIARIQADSLFEEGHPELTRAGKQTLRKVASVLINILPKYLGARTGPRVSSVFIEGHTDSLRVNEEAARKHGYKNNWGLSALRAINTYEEMNKYLSEKSVNAVTLDSLKNDDSQPLFGVSGYGKRRPLAGAPAEVPKGSDKETMEAFREDVKQWCTRNRRIDIRIIMASPKPSVVKEIGKANTANQVNAK